MEEINGFYFDDGTKYNPDLYPKPNLCLVCRKNDDKSENLLCNLTRLDQHNEKEFKCGAFESLNSQEQPTK
jgi:hypothetical protein